MSRWADGLKYFSRLLMPALWERVGSGLGALIAALPLRDVRRARAHLAQAYPTWSAAAVDGAARAVFINAGRSAGATLAAFGRDGLWARRRLLVDDRQRLAAVLTRLRAGRGCVIFTGHLGNWELLGRACAGVGPLSVIGKRLRSPTADAIVKTLRTGTGARQIDQDADPRVILADLRQGRMVAILNDQDIPRLSGAFVPWFGSPAWTPLAPGVVAQSAGAWFTAACYRRAGRWRLHLGPLHLIARNPDREAAAVGIIAIATAEWEALVRTYPQQWAWWHKRWRTRPVDRPAARSAES